ncbi:peptide-methionine (R)-S-oxide reductase MsrB [soil metagenome]
MTTKIDKTNDEWKKELDPEVYHVTREKGTEAPGTGKLLHNKETGLYSCSNCGTELFSSETKFDSGSGWPSFYDVANSDAVELHEDSAYGMNRTEVTCRTCGAHLGHVFPDGPSDKTGQRYCINSLSLNFKKKE